VGDSCPAQAWPSHQGQPAASQAARWRALSTSISNQPLLQVGLPAHWGSSIRQPLTYSTMMFVLFGYNAATCSGPACAPLAAGRLALIFELMDMNIYELIRGRKHYVAEERMQHFM
jgi:hypothetical protein